MLKGMLAVIHRPDQRVHSLLSKFNDNNRKYYVFEDLTDKVRKEYASATVKKYRLPDGTLLNIDKETAVRFSVPMDRQEAFDIMCADGNMHDYDTSGINTVVRDKRVAAESAFRRLIIEELGIKIVDAPVSDDITFEQFCKRHGYRKQDDRYGVFQNPNSKFDYYEVGGYGCNILKLKPGCKGSYINNGKRQRAGSDILCSQACIKDIDFTPSQEEYEEAVRTWEVIVEGQPLKEGERRPHYNKEYLTTRYRDKKDYLNRATAFSTYAVVTPNGEWHDNNDSEWVVDAANIEEDWEANYHQFIDSASPDDIMTIVDFG